MTNFWATDKHDQKVYKHVLNDGGDIEVEVTNYGAIITGLWVNLPNKRINTVLSYPSFDEYQNDKAFIGAVVGRYCNRIANAQFELNGQTYRLPANNGPHHLHGGPQGYYQRTWEIKEADKQHIVLALHSPDGDAGYPGDCQIVMEYSLSGSTFSFTWQAESSKDTVISLTNHSYFNLSGTDSLSDHFLKIPFEYYTPLKRDGIPTGTVEPVKDSHFDFTKAKNLPYVLQKPPKVFEAFNGIDHNWCRSQSSNVDQTLSLAAELNCVSTGLKMQVLSTLPALQCYTGNYLAGSGPFKRHQGICLETQHSPNSPNQANFPPAILRAGQTIKHTTQFTLEQYETDT